MYDAGRHIIRNIRNFWLKLLFVLATAFAYVAAWADMIPHDRAAQSGIRKARMVYGEMSSSSSNAADEESYRSAAPLKDYVLRNAAPAPLRDYMMRNAGISSVINRSPNYRVVGVGNTGVKYVQRSAPIYWPTS